MAINQARHRDILHNCIAYLEAHLEKASDEGVFGKIVNDFVEAIDEEFPSLEGERLEKATKGFVRHWPRKGWPTLGQFIKGVQPHIPALPVAQIEKQAGPTGEQWARQIMADWEGWAVENGCYGWIEDWAKENPGMPLTLAVAERIKANADRDYRLLFEVAQGIGNELTDGEEPLPRAKGWAQLAVDTIERREAGRHV